MEHKAAKRHMKTPGFGVHGEEVTSTLEYGHKKQPTSKTRRATEVLRVQHSSESEILKLNLCPTSTITISIAIELTAVTVVQLVRHRPSRIYLLGSYKREKKVENVWAKYYNSWLLSLSKHMCIIVQPCDSIQQYQADVHTYSGTPVMYNIYIYIEREIQKGRGRGREGGREIGCTDRIHIFQLQNLLMIVLSWKAVTKETMTLKK